MTKSEKLEKLGAFYLGRVHDLATGETGAEPILYDAKDLTTHAVIVGMTGSGKTGLGVGLLEEAALDGVPAIAIDPKGDLGNLLLAFPRLRAADFRPWIDEGAAARASRTPDEHATWTADLWRKGIKDWGQDAARVGRFKKAAQATIYTPGSTAGVPLTVLRSFNAPAASLAEDADALRERVQTATSGLLALLGIEADPITSREHILVSMLLDRAWRAGEDRDLATLIGEIQKPPIEQVGVLDLESFFPAKERFALAMRLNNLLASPGFAPWMTGEALDVSRLLYTEDGAPRLAIISIAHLSDAERMFFVTLLLNEVLAWARAQPGTQSLRALLYMDEVFGYFPPTANPPSKRPMLTLLKQARAYGLGVVLATQNPVDLDYKGLSNTGTWMLGRLQTERDKARVMEGLEGAAAGAAANFDRAAMERTLAGLGSRVFLLHNVHDDAPVVFHTRWALSYLAGPLTREQIKRLAGPGDRATATDDVNASAGDRAVAKRTAAAGAKTAADETGTTTRSRRRARADTHTTNASAADPLAPDATSTATRAAAKSAGTAARPAPRPVLPPNVSEGFLPVRRAIAADSEVLYRPGLLATATLHFVNARAEVDEWSNLTVLAPLGSRLRGSPWADASESEGTAPELDDAPEEPARFARLPASAANAKQYPRWQKMLKTHLGRSKALTLWRCKALKVTSTPGQTEGEFRVRVRELAREARDRALEKLRARYTPKLQRMRERIQTAELRVEREQSQYRQQKTQTMISVGATVLGALFGRKAASVGTVGRATTAMRGAGRTARERGDVSRATEKVETLRRRLEELEATFEEDLADVRDAHEPEGYEYDEVAIRPRKSDLAVDSLTLVWTPYSAGPDGEEPVA